VVAAPRPGPPRFVFATPGDGQARVGFTEPVSDGAGSPSYYTVTASPGGQSASGPASPIVVSGLTNGVSYTFTVTATRTGLTGEPSLPSAAVVPAGAERPHPEPPAAEPRPPVPDFVPPNRPRPPPPHH
jgi:hypothetical protein